MREVIRKHLDLNLKFVSLGSFIGCLAVQVCIIKNSAFYKLRESDEKVVQKLDLMMCPHFEVCEN